PAELREVHEEHQGVARLRARNQLETNRSLPVGEPQLTLERTRAQRLEETPLPCGLDQPEREVVLVQPEEPAAGLVGREHTTVAIEQQSNHGRLFQQVLERARGRLRRLFPVSAPPAPALPDHQLPPAMSSDPARRGLKGLAAVSLSTLMARKTAASRPPETVSHSWRSSRRLIKT